MGVHINSVLSGIVCYAYNSDIEEKNRLSNETDLGDPENVLGLYHPLPRNLKHTVYFVCNIFKGILIWYGHDQIWTMNRRTCYVPTTVHKESNYRLLKPVAFQIHIVCGATIKNSTLPSAVLDSIRVPRRFNYSYLHFLVARKGIQLCFVWNLFNQEI